MGTILQNWLDKQKDLTSYAFRFLHHNEYNQELNHFFELKNRIPVAINAVGGIVYAEIFGEEILFSIFYADQGLDYHLADSTVEFEALLAKSSSRDFFLHVAHCAIGTYDVVSFSKRSMLPALEAALGPLKEGEIYGYSEALYDEETRGRSVSHWLSNLVPEKAAIWNAQAYLAKSIEKFDRKTKGTSIYDHADAFYSSSSVREDLEKYKPNVIKNIYRNYTDDILPNLRCMHNCNLGYLQHTTRLNYFTETSFDSAKKDIFSLLRNNRELLRISIGDKTGFGMYDSTDDKNWLGSFEALNNFSLLKSIHIDNLGLRHFPEELTRLQNLESISFFKAGLKDLPESLGTMQQLQELQLTGCALDGKTDVIGKLKGLTSLSLRDCGLTSFPEALRQLTALEHLDLSENPLQEIPEWISELQHLKTIELASCGLKTLPESIGNLPDVASLEVKGNAFETLPKSLLKLKSKVAIEVKSKALYDEKVRKKLEKDGMKPAVFTDFNFKLMVVQSLMYDKELLLPKFDVWEFAKNYKARKIDVEDEGYDMIPEVKQYFEDLEIPKILLEEIDELNGGMSVYQEISPLWGGEDDYYDVMSVKDAKQLPNLKKVQFDCLGKKSLLGQLERMGIEASY